MAFNFIYTVTNLIPDRSLWYSDLWCSYIDSWCLLLRISVSKEKRNWRSEGKASDEQKERGRGGKTESECFVCLFMFKGGIGLHGTATLSLPDKLHGCQMPIQWEFPFMLLLNPCDTQRERCAIHNIQISSCDSLIAAFCASPGLCTTTKHLTLHGVSSLFAQITLIHTNSHTDSLSLTSVFVWSLAGRTVWSEGDSQSRGKNDWNVNRD